MSKLVTILSLLMILSGLTLASKSIGQPLAVSVERLEHEARKYSDRREWGHAQEVYGKILAINEKRWDKDDPRLLLSLSNVVRVTCVDGKCADTVPYLNRMLAIRLKQLGPHHADVATTYALIAEANEKMMHYKDANENFGRAVEVRDAVFGKTDSISISTRLNVIRVMLKQHDFASAEKVRRECQTLAQKQKPHDQALLTKISYYKKRIAEAATKTKNASR
ncbi:MAG: tetratricopeptide repeat protein [Leptolyngbya sp.]|nr:tetratricopeptide repeat protein [Candidatus Melainabacteria bacterium]